MKDVELLREYAQSRSPGALEELVRRHVGWVSGVARRCVRDGQLAEDVTQAVFIVISQKPPRLPNDAALASWLFTTVYRISSRVLRGEARRRRREQAFAMEHREAGGGDERMSQAQWDEIAPHLDRALMSLKDDDRRALLLRFYQQKSHAQVADELGVSADVARQRVGRAVERLREILKDRGVAAPPVVMLATGLLAYTTAPAGAAVVQGAIVAATGVAGASQAAAFAKGSLIMIAINKAKIAAVAFIGLMLVVGGTTAVIVMKSAPPAGQKLVDTPAAPPALMDGQLSLVNGFGFVASPAPEGWRARFDAVYRLEDGQDFKVIPPPFIAERLTYYQTAASPEQVRAIPRGPDVYIFRWVDGQLSNWGMSFGNPGPAVSEVMTFVMRRKTYEFQMPPELADFRIEGDWITREELPVPGRLEAICETVRKLGGPSMQFVQRDLVRPVIVVTGQYAFQAAAGAADRFPGVHFYTDSAELADSGGGGGSGALRELLMELGSRANMPIAVEITGDEPPQISYRYHRSSYDLSRLTGAARDQAIRKLLDNVESQTGLKLVIEPRKVPVWVAEPVQ